MAFSQECQLILIQLERRLDWEYSKTLKEKLAKLVPQRHHLWIIDLAEVDFMDSSGFYTLITGLSHIRSSGCRLVICNLEPPIRIIFELTQMDLAFEVFESYNAVLTTINSQYSNIDQSLLL